MIKKIWFNGLDKMLTNHIMIFKRTLGKPLQEDTVLILSTDFKLLMIQNNK